jgi:hypothetical protein
VREHALAKHVVRQQSLARVDAVCTVAQKVLVLPVATETRLSTALARALYFNSEKKRMRGFAAL